MEDFRMCSKCRGVGRIFETKEVCMKCNGEGYIENKRKSKQD